MITITKRNMITRMKTIITIKINVNGPENDDNKNNDNNSNVKPGDLIWYE